MSEVVKLPVEKVFPRTMTPREIWAQPEPPDEMIWEVCVYTKGGEIDRCKHCPKRELDEHGRSIQQFCRGWAAEACRVVFAMQARALGKSA